MPQPSWVTGRLAAEPLWSRVLYGTILKRSSTYMTAVMITATFVGIGYDYAMDSVWNTMNRGVRCNSHSTAARPVPRLLRSAAEPAV